MPLADPNTDRPSPENPRREVVAFLADRLEPGESGFFKAKDVRKATDMTGSLAGQWLARLAGVHADERYPYRPSPCFDIKVWSRSSGKGRVYRVERHDEYPAVFPMLGGGEA